MKKNQFGNREYQLGWCNLTLEVQKYPRCWGLGFQYQHGIMTRGVDFYIGPYTFSLFRIRQRK